MGDPDDTPDGTGQRWTFLTNHARVLICIASDPGVRIRDIAECTGITERATQTILGGLEERGYLTRQRTGRRVTYTITPDLPLPEPDTGATTSDLIALFSPHQHRQKSTSPHPPGTTPE